MALHDSSDYLLEVRISGHFFKPRDPGAGSSVPLSIFGGGGGGGVVVVGGGCSWDQGAGGTEPVW